MRPRTSAMLQQNNNNNYPCLGMSGATRDVLQKCSRAALPFPGRLELGDLPLIRGLRAWALCSKNRRRPGAGQAPFEPPPPRSSPCCPRPADMYLTGEWGSMGYGIPLGLDAQQSGIGALVTVATLKTTEGNGKTQTQCLFLRTEKGSCLYSPPKPGSGGAAGAVSGWLRGKTRVSKEPGRRDPGVQVQSGANRVRVRSGRRWRKSCNGAGREKAGPSHERSHGGGGQQEVQDKGGPEQEAANPPSECETGSQRSPEAEAQSRVRSTEDFCSSGLLTPDHEGQQCHYEENQRTPTVDPSLDIMNPSGDVMGPGKPQNRDESEDPSEETPADSVTFSSMVTSPRTSGEPRTLIEVLRVEEQNNRNSCLLLTNCDADLSSPAGDDEVTDQLSHVLHGPEPQQKLDQPGSSRTRGDSQGSGLLTSSLDLHLPCPDATQPVDPGIPGAGDENIPLHLTPKKELEDHCSISSPAEGNTCLSGSDDDPEVELKRKKSEFPQQDEELRRLKIVRDCGQTEGGAGEHREDDEDDDGEDDGTCQVGEEEQRSERSRGTFPSRGRGSNEADLLHSLTLSNPASPGVMATVPPRPREGEATVGGTGPGAQDGSEGAHGELENPEEEPLGEGEDDFGVFMQAEGELEWSHPGTDPALQHLDNASSWTPDWTQSSSPTDDAWTAFPPAVEGPEEAPGPWWPAEEERKGRSHNLASLFTEAFPSEPGPAALPDPDPVMTLTQILQDGAGQHKCLLDSFHDLNKMIVQRNRRGGGASRDLLLRTLRLETPCADSRPAPWPTNRRPSPGLSSSARHAQMASAKRRLSYDYNRNSAE